VRARSEGPRERSDVGIARRRVTSAADTQRLFLRIPSKEAAAGGILINYTQDE